MSYFDLLLFQNTTNFLVGNALDIWQHYKAIEVVLGGLFGYALSLEMRQHTNIGGGTPPVDVFLLEEGLSSSGRVLWVVFLDKPVIRKLFQDERHEGRL